MKAKRIAAALAGLCLIWGTAQAGPDVPDRAQAQPPAATAGDIPPGVGALGNDVIVLELGPAPDGTAISPDEAAAMQMLLLQLLMMQSEGGGGAGAPEMMLIVPDASPGTSI